MVSDAAAAAAQLQSFIAKYQSLSLKASLQ
jgi:hypothetical protein